MESSAPKIRVVVRKRPLTQKEQKKQEIDIIKIYDGQTLSVEELK